MRSIVRSVPPLELTDQTKDQLTERYIHTKEDDVWNRPFIRTALAQMFQDKCAYCEARLDEKSMYMEIDHFYPKSKYPSMVVDWDNLFASCKHCNASKGEHDPNVEPIIDPTRHNPREHIQLYNCRFVALDDLGQASIDVLNLNHYRHTGSRFRIGETVMELIDQAQLLLDEYLKNKTTRTTNRVLRTIARLLTECSSDSEYSVVVATILAENLAFKSVCERMQAHSLWTEQLEQGLRDALEVACARHL